MAAESRRSDPTVADLLFEEGYRFSFFEAVRVLERLAPERQPVGHDASPIGEVVRFRTRLSLDFPPSEIHEITRDEDGGPPRMTVAFMGLTGPLGVLPRHYTELLLARVRGKDFALRDFLDLFNHRFISLFYRAWEKYRFPLAYERALSKGQSEDRFSLYLYDLFGMGTAGLRGRLVVQDKPLLYYAGLLSQHRHSSSALAGLLTDYFGVPVHVDQFVGQWLPLTEDSRTRLGPNGANNVLGDSALAGSRVWDQQAKFKVRLGPLTLSQFTQFLPSGSAFKPLVQLTRFFAGQAHDFDVQLVLRAEQVPWCRLGGAGDYAPRLGWSAWLKTREFDRDAGDAVFSGALTRLGAMPDETRLG
jgi:type VI secretion system protein ImpH